MSKITADTFVMYEGEDKTICRGDIWEVIFTVSDLADGMRELCKNALDGCSVEDAGCYRLLMLGLRDIAERIHTLAPNHEIEKRHGLISEEGSI